MCCHLDHIPQNIFPPILKLWQNISVESLAHMCSAMLYLGQMWQLSATFGPNDLAIWVFCQYLEAFTRSLWNLFIQLDACPWALRSLREIGQPQRPIALPQIYWNHVSLCASISLCTLFVRRPNLHWPLRLISRKCWCCWNGDNFHLFFYFFKPMSCHAFLSKSLIWVRGSIYLSIYLSVEIGHKEIGHS